VSDLAGEIQSAGVERQSAVELWLSSL
jgi:hypothetical protein